MKKITSFLILFFTLTLFGQKWITSPSGVKYKVIKDAPGTNAKFGDIVQLHFQFRNYKDSLVNSSLGRDPVEFKLQSAFKGSLESGITLMSPGDSMVFEVPSDSLGFPQRPPFIPVGSKVYFRVKLLNVWTEAQYQEELLKRAEARKKTEDTKIKDYIKAKGYTATAYPSGLYIVKTKTGTGPKAEQGKTVQVHYTGTLLNGQKFDSSVDRGQPFSFGLGQGQVIGGWDQGIAELQVGDKAILLIPSHLGYGERGSGGSIPGNSILVFEVELLGVQ